LVDRNAVGSAVDVGARGEYESNIRMLLERGEHGGSAEHVHPDGRNRIRRRERGNGHTGEMHDGIRSRPRERALNVLKPRDVTFMDTHATLDCREVSEGRRLVREAVHLVASRHEMLGEMTARETGDASAEHTE